MIPSPSGIESSEEFLGAAGDCQASTLTTKFITSDIVMPISFEKIIMFMLISNRDLPYVVDRFSCGLVFLFHDVGYQRELPVLVLHLLL